jgi:alkanesulfonate monooxygenase SsuD/methylene tetrahydromethanopterin reductase-like flavin-dependent oxidoreductase (luciferase family)
MGSATTNFYNAAFQRAGFEDDAKAIQRLWIAGKRQEAVARVPDEMVTRFGAIGTPEMVRDRFHKYQQAGVDALTLRIEAADLTQRISKLEQVIDLIRSLDA